MEHAVRVAADRDVCAGSGQCVLSAPGVFDQAEDDGLVVVLAQPAAEDEADVRIAARLCPAGALQLEE
jgi:ferredoxin